MAVRLPAPLKCLHTTPATGRMQCSTCVSCWYEDSDRRLSIAEIPFLAIGGPDLRKRFALSGPYAVVRDEAAIEVKRSIGNQLLHRVGFMVLVETEGSGGAAQEI